MSLGNTQNIDDFKKAIKNEFMAKFASHFNSNSKGIETNKALFDKMQAHSIEEIFEKYYQKTMEAYSAQALLLIKEN